MKKRYGRNAIISLLALTCIGLTGCGGGKDTDPETEGVLEITITPIVTPTPAPAEINPDAVTTSGNVTMVNSYLAEKESTGTSSQEDSDTGSGTQEDAGSSSQTEDDTETGTQTTDTQTDTSGGEDGTSEG